MKDINKRLETLEKTAKQELNGIVTFANGEKRTMPAIDIILAALKERRSGGHGITAVEWLECSGDNGIMPDIAEALIYGASDSAE